MGHIQCDEKDGVAPGGGATAEREIANRGDLPYLFGMIHSRVTSKAQTTIPRPVREALGLKEGDELSYAIDGDRVIVTRRALPDPFVGNLATFTEWADEADRRAYDGF